MRFFKVNNFVKSSILTLSLCTIGNVYANTEVLDVTPPEQLNYYIKCYNEISSDILDSIERYSSWLQDLNEGPTGKEKVIYGTYSVSESLLKNCADISNGKTEDKIGIQNDFSVLSKTLPPLVNVINEMENYYSMEDYKDDDFAKGKALHTKFLSAVVPFEGAFDAFSVQLESVDKQNTKANIQALENDPSRKEEYLIAISTFTANELTTILSEESFDVETAKSKIDELDGYLKKMDELGFNDSTKTSFLMLDFKGFSKSARDRYRRVRDKEEYNRSELMLLESLPSAVKGSPGEVIDRYNRLVDSLNRSKF